MNLNEYNVVFASDSPYVKHMLTSIVSLLENNKNIEINIFIIHEDINVGQFNNIGKTISKYKCNLYNIKINDSRFNNLILNIHLTKSTYFRLLIPELIPKERVLYLDSDIIITGSIANFYNSDLEDNCIAAYIDCFVEDEVTHLKNLLGMKFTSKYFNAGVLLIDTKKWISELITTKAIKFIEENNSIISYSDQCGLNAIIDGKFTLIDPIYNLQTHYFNKKKLFDIENSSLQNLNFINSKPFIIHFTGLLKPWHFSLKHPYKYFYYRYRFMSAYWFFIPHIHPNGVLKDIKGMVPLYFKIKLANLLSNFKKVSSNIYRNTLTKLT